MLFIFEVPSMVPESFFECCFSSTKTSFTFIVSFIRDFLFHTQYWVKGGFSIHSTFISNSFVNLAIASKVFFAGIQNSFFMTISQISSLIQVISTLF